ncbi:HU family DNA-binding protein [Paenibacillus sp. FSL H3-0333]|uniref:HU family DNA-binding protein n=1 Tax=Paenibacillus sp. FSL H3-0333 TaxID=2921373 RepID=UPI0030FA2060
MNKQELTIEVIKKTGLEKKVATEAVDAVFETITAALSTGDKVSIYGFGNFDVRNRAARLGVNPKLLKELKEQGIDPEVAKVQATIQIEASKAPAFKPASALKKAIK